MVIDPAQLEGFVVPDDRVAFRVRADGHQLSGELKPRGLRKALAAISEHGVENVALVVQGVLGEHNTIAEAGIVAQPRAPKT